VIWLIIRKSKNWRQNVTDQFNFLHDGNKWEDEWVGMPEYSNKEIKPFKTIKMHFKTEEDHLLFAQCIGQNLTEKTKSAWYPAQVKGLNSAYRYVDES
jgi:hypothetical protein|tara:strand:- start:111 stop:404 length:294 start_codon:yes stop_codon:yes gene_type:complete